MRVALLGTGTPGREAAYAGRTLRLLRQAGADVTALRGADDAEALDLARAAISAGTETLVVVGGNERVQVGVEAVLDSPARLGVVATGRGDDLARSLGLPRGDPAAAVRIVLGGRERVVDLLRVGGRPYATGLSAGLDALVEERAERLAGRSPRLRRLVAAADALRALEPVEYTLDLDGETVRTEASLVLVASTPSYAGLRLAAGALLDDGLLDVVVRAPMSRRELAQTFPRLRDGTLAPRPGDLRRRARRVSVAAPGVVAYADGKRVGPLPVTTGILPGAVRVCVPRP